MNLRGVLMLVLAAGAGTLALHAQKAFKEYDTVEGHAEANLPADYKQPAEWTRARLMYRDYAGARGGFGFGNGSWTIDYPRSDRHLLQGIRRLTRIDTRSVEQAVALDNTDDVYNWPFIYAVEVGHWDLDRE